MAHICEICHDLHGSYTCHVWNVSNCLPTKWWPSSCYPVYDSGFCHAARPTFQNSHDLHDIYYDPYIHIPNPRQRDDWL